VTSRQLAAAAQASTTPPLGILRDGLRAVGWFALPVQAFIQLSRRHQEPAVHGCGACAHYGEGAERVLAGFGNVFYVEVGAAVLPRRPSINPLHPSGVIGA
jgi:hypothetical protein